MDDSLRALQLRELELLDALVRLCERHGLRYYLIGGTLLGAVRNGGFIPWDDDIDVIMPRPDYDRFAALCQSELDSAYFYQSPETDPHYFLTYAKLRKNGTEIYEERFRLSRFHKGVFIDIFPLDACPAPGLLSHFLFNTLAVMNYRGQVDSGEPYVPYRELSGKLGYAFLRLFSPRALTRFRRRVIGLAARLGNGSHLASYSGAYGYRKEVYPSGWFAEGRDGVFEQKSYRIPRQAELVLRQLYGADYLEPQLHRDHQHIDLAESKGQTRNTL